MCSEPSLICGGGGWEGSFPPVARYMRMLSTVLITAGIVVLADVAITLAWKEPVSSLYGRIQQDRLAGELETLQKAFPDEETLQAVEQAKGVHAKIGVLADHFAREVALGDA